MSEPVFFYCVQCQMQLSEPHHHDDGRRGMSDDAIREAAADALGNYRAGWCGDHRECLIGMGDAVIDAVRPLIEADLRERLAAAIEAVCNHPYQDVDGHLRTPCADCRATARIVRERP